LINLTTNVRKILKSIDINGSESIRLWKQNLEKSIAEMDEEAFKALFALVKD
jgi:hypothetical protein